MDSDAFGDDSDGIGGIDAIEGSSRGGRRVWEGREMGFGVSDVSNGSALAARPSSSATLILIRTLEYVGTSGQS